MSLRHHEISSSVGIGGTAMELLALLLAVVGFWLATLCFNPWVKCSKCDGKPKIKGWISTHAHHICDKCGGTGQQLRPGRKQIFGVPKL
jgi:hypothetical protein